MGEERKSGIRELITLLAVGAVIFIAALSFSFVNKVKDSILSDTLGNISEKTIRLNRHGSIYKKRSRRTKI